MKIGYHASHEQFSPGELLELVQSAEKAGFEMAMCSDHLFPWSSTQGHSGFAWSWLGAALQATNFSFGVVNAPGWRYHPVIVAQAAATLAQMFPDRFWIAVGSGEALNEHITGEAWPPKKERNARLLECATMMRRLWRGETVTHRGLVTAVEARVYSRPERAPLLVGAALTNESAEWMGAWADALITTGRKREEMQQIIDAFRRGGGEGKPIFVQTKHAWGKNERDIVDDALEQWAPNLLGSPMAADLTMPEHFEQAASLVTEERLRENVVVSSELSVHLERLRTYRELGVERVYVHNVGTNQREFIETFGREVLPQLERTVS